MRSSTSCAALNDSYSGVNTAIFNPYSKASLINSIGDEIAQLEQNSEYWNDLSEFLQRCEYKQQTHVKPSKSNELKVFSLNVRSLQKNISHFREEIDTYRKYDVLSLNETNCTLSKLPNGIHDLILEDFYEPIVQDPARKKSGRGGGLAIYINKRVCDPEQIESFRPKYDSEGETIGEFQFVKIHRCKGYNKTKLIANVYRSPASRNVDKFTGLLDKVLRSLDRHSRKQIVFTGDFNIDLIKYEKDLASQNLIDIFEKYGFAELVSKPTRVTDHSATLIDHVYTNDLANTVSCHVITLDISDHLATVTTLSLGDHIHQRVKTNASCEQLSSVRRFNEASNSAFKNLIESETWSEVLEEECAEMQYEKFCETYTKLVITS